MGRAVVALLIFVGGSAFGVWLQNRNVPDSVLGLTVVVCYGTSAIIAWWRRWKAAWMAFWSPVSAVPCSVEVFTHSAALASNPMLPETIEQFFRSAGWKVRIGKTNLGLHAKGVWVRGPDEASRSTLSWAMRSLDINANVDDANPNAIPQVIVGAAERALDKEESGPATMTRPELNHHRTDAHRDSGSTFPTVQAGRPTPPLTIKWARSNCSGLKVENRRISPLRGVRVVLEKIERVSETTGEYYEADIQNGHLPGILTGGSTEVRHEPINPVVFSFVTEVTTNTLRIPLQNVDGSNTQPLTLRQTGRFRARLSVLWDDNNRFDSMAMFDWTDKNSHPAPVGEVADWSTAAPTP